MIENNERIQQVLNTLEGTFGICITDTKGIIQYINNHFCEMTSYDKKELYHQSYRNLNLQLNDVKKSISKTTLAGKTWSGKVICRSKDNVEKWLHLVIIPIHQNNQTVEQYMILSNDVTDHMLVKRMANETLETLTNITMALDEASIVAITDDKGVIQHVNDKFCEISQYAREELVGKTHRIINSKHHPKSFFKNMWETILAGEVWKNEVKNRAKDGSYYWMNTTVVPILSSSGKVKQFISIRTDITKRIQAEKELAQVMKGDFKKVVQNLQNWVFKVYREADQMRFLLSEGKLAEELGILTENVRRRLVSDVLKKNRAEELETHLLNAFDGEKVNVKIPYNERYIDVMLTPVIENGAVTEVVGSISDITERKKAEDLILHMANYDPLTDLANRTHFTNLLREELNQAEKKQESLAVLFIDLDRFKNINDSLGHLTGDRILVKIASELKASVRKGDVVSRQGGDEFTIYLPDVDRQEAGEIAMRIIDTLSAPITLDNLELYVTPSIGVSMFPDDGGFVEELITNADSAMYLAKKHGRNNFQFYTKKLQQSMMTKLALELDLRQALDGNQLELYYQTKMDIANSQITGAEALIRWNHPEHGLIPPNKFIPIAEETGIIIEIGEWVLETACQQAKQWHDDGYDGMTVAVNISIRQFMQNNLDKVIKNILEKTGLPPQFLELEITESMTSDAAYTIRTLEKIKALGVIVSIDDFGTGYSSLSYLSRFPVDKLKIDQSFVRDLNTTNQSIIKAIIDVAENLAIDVIAEGVEEIEQVNFLIDQNCTEAQGYFFSKPVPVGEIGKVLNQYVWKKAL